MKAITLISALLLSLTLLTSCEERRLSTKSLAKEVKSSIKEKYAADPDTAIIQVKGLTLVHQGGALYQGLLETVIEGEKVEFGVAVTYDGESFVWQVD